LLQAGFAGSIDDSHYPGCSAVYQTPGADPKQRWWHVLDNAFILPEYIAEVCLTQPAGKDLFVFIFYFIPYSLGCGASCDSSDNLA